MGPDRRVAAKLGRRPRRTQARPILLIRFDFLPVLICKKSVRFALFSCKYELGFP
jgi:hypothetical protein